MISRRHQSRALADISALADGTLPPHRREEVETSVAASPELATLLERERLAVARLTEAAERDRAPQALREQIERQRAAAARARPAAARRWPDWRPLGPGRLAGAGLVAALVIAALVLALALPGGTPGAPTLSQAAALATRGASLAAPAPDPQHPGARLEGRVDDLYFPNWAHTPLRWRPTGQRVDRLGSHRAVTVFYARDGVQIAYTILSTPPLRQPAAVVVRSGSRSFRALLLHGRMVVTWRRQGHTCVLSGRGVPASILAKLAAWKPR